MTTTVVVELPKDVSLAAPNYLVDHDAVQIVDAKALVTEAAGRDHAACSKVADCFQATGAATAVEDLAADAAASSASIAVEMAIDVTVDPLLAICRIRKRFRPRGRLQAMPIPTTQHVVHGIS